MSDTQTVMRENEETIVSVVGRLAGRLILTALGVLVLFIGAAYAYDFGKEIFYQKPMEAEPGTDVELELPGDITYGEFAALLKEKGLIRNETALELQARLYHTALEPGTYSLNTSMTSREILKSVEETAVELKEAAEAETEETEAGMIDAGSEEDSPAAEIKEKSSAEGAAAEEEGNR